MKLVELRIVLPVTLEEFRAAHYYVRNRYRNEANDTRSSTLISQKCIYKREPNIDSSNPSPSDTSSSKEAQWCDSHGTFVQYHHLFNNILPNWANTILGGSTLKLVGNTWDEFPMIYGNYRIPAFPRIRIDMKSSHVDNDEGRQSNHFNLSPKELTSRQITHIDLAEEVLSELKLRGESATNFPTKRMCVYIAIECEVNLLLPTQIRAKGEDLAINHIVDVLIQLHRLTHLWRRDWEKVELADIVAKTTQDSTTNNSTETDTITKVYSLEELSTLALSAPPQPYSRQNHTTNHNNNNNSPSGKMNVKSGRNRLLRSRL